MKQNVSNLLKVKKKLLSLFDDLKAIFNNNKNNNKNNENENKNENENENDDEQCHEIKE